VLSGRKKESKRLDKKLFHQSGWRTLSSNNTIRKDLWRYCQKPGVLFVAGHHFSGVSENKLE
jgi:hypothetical protein